jgi:hypothetical protein
MVPELIVANTLSEEEVRRVILENQERLTKSMYEPMSGITEEILKEKVTQDINEAQKHVHSLVETAKLAMFNPEKIVVYRLAGEPFCGVYDITTQTIYAERTVIGCDYARANEIDTYHGGGVSMYHKDFSGLLSNLMTRARLRIFLGKK